MDSQKEDAARLHCGSVVWVPSIVEQIVRYLPTNFVACCVRLVNKASAVQFRGRSQLSTVHLSQPCSPEAFVWHWSRPHATRSLTLKQRRIFLRLTAASGVLSNLQLAITLSGLLDVADLVSLAAAEKGHVHILEWLLREGRLDLKEATLLLTAAQHGHQGLCAWLLDHGCEFLEPAIATAAQGGHLRLARWLALMRHQFLSENGDKSLLTSLLAKAATGMDLESLQQLFADWTAGAFDNHNGETTGDTEVGEEQFEGEEEERRQAKAELRQVQQELRMAEEALKVLQQQQQLGRQQQQQQLGRQQPEPQPRRGGHRAHQRQRPARGPPPPRAALSEPLLRAEMERAQQRVSALRQHVARHQLRLALLLPVRRQLSVASRWTVVANAAAGLTADWRAKVEWLEWVGFGRERAQNRAAVRSVVLNGQELRTWRASTSAATASDVPSGPQPPQPGAGEASAADGGQGEVLIRLEWLRQRGYPVSSNMVMQAVHANEPAALQFVLKVLPPGSLASERGSWNLTLDRAACNGSVELLDTVLQLAAGEGEQVNTELMLTSAASQGHLHVLRWWDETWRPDAETEPPGSSPAWLTAAVWCSAAFSGNMELVAWLWDKDGGGAQWSTETFVSAVESGSEEVVEWFAERGCPMGDDGLPYIRAGGEGDLATLRCLRRLGCPWSPDGSTFTRVVFRNDLQSICLTPAVMMWLLQEGCPVDWAAAEKAANALAARCERYGMRVNPRVDFVRWMVAQQQSQQQRQ